MSSRPRALSSLWLRFRPQQTPFVAQRQSAKSGTTVVSLPALLPLPTQPSSWRARAIFALRMRGVHFAILAVIATALACAIHRAQLGYATAVDNFGWDAALHMRGAIPAPQVAQTLPQSKDIITIELPQAVPRPVLAQVLSKLRLAKVVAIDLMLLDREAIVKAQHLPAQEEKAWYGSDIIQWRGETRLLAAQLRQLPHVVIGTWPEQERSFNPRTQSYGPFRTVWHRPAPLIWQATRAHAHLTIVGDENSALVRRVRLWEDTGKGTRQPCFGLVIAALKQGLSPTQLARGIPTAPDGTVLINYLGGRECFDYDTNRIACGRVLDGYAAPEDFKDKIVLIGENSLASKEIKDTTFGAMPGMHIHAMVAATLLAPQGAPCPVSPFWCAGIALLCCGLLLLPLIKWDTWTIWPSAAVQVGCIVLFSGWLFTARNLVLPISIPLMALAITLNGAACMESHRIRNILGRFIGSAMPPLLQSFGTGPRLGGTEKVASAFFCDVRGYSELAAKLPLKTLELLINEYTSALVKVVRKHGGRPIDFQGDGMFVLFEANTPEDNFALRAVSAAMEAQEVFKGLRPRWTSWGVPDFEAGIAIATGPMLIGMVGSEEHLKPGAVGDVVNVAARLQSLSAQCGYNVLMTRVTWERVREEIATVPCGDHIIKGHYDPIEVWGAGSVNLACAMPIHLVPPLIGVEGKLEKLAPS